MQVRLAISRTKVDLHEPYVRNMMFSHDIDTLRDEILIDGAIEEIILLQVQNIGRANQVQATKPAQKPEPSQPRCCY